ncbi:MAG TPA: AraC family transcriptional regulator [Myxococcaceae bacterium]|nr:AraC family transcriptional regulator [Myxococcaceae bacterium]
MSQDTLSDVLRTVRLQGAVFFYVSGGRRWAAEAPASRDIAPAVMPGAEHVMEYHLVTSGDCWASIVGKQPVRLTRGDIILFPYGDAHVLSSAPGMRADPKVSWYHEMQIDRLPLRVAYDGTSGPMEAPPGHDGLTTLACGFLSCDIRPFNPLIATLPRLLHLRAADGGGLFAEFIQRAVAESHTRRPGGEAMLARMSEMLFVDAVRRYLDSLPPDAMGWLAGLRDRFVGRALALLHEEPAKAWTLDELGRKVGLSRSPLHERFVQFVGQPPMQYLTHWRMQLASGLLRSSNSTVGSIALEVGYASEAAFARAFKRLVGQPPAAWRRTLGQPTGRAGPHPPKVPSPRRTGTRRSSGEIRALGAKTPK